jgi:hypothetical protein
MTGSFLTSTAGWWWMETGEHAGNGFSAAAVELDERHA